MTDRPNVLMVVLDTARAAEFRDGATPAYRQLADEGFVWHHAVSPSIWTVPAHASLFSGLLPSEHRVWGYASPREGGWRRRVAELDQRWLPSILSRSGYDTFAISANPYITPMLGFGPGFDRWFHRMRADARRDLPRSSPRHRIRALKRFVRLATHMSVPRDRGAREAMSVLDGQLAQARPPFFGFINLLEAHAPYWTPGAGQLPLDQRLLALLLVAPGAHRLQTRFNALRMDFPPVALAMLRSIYGLAIRYLDGILERIGELLASRGLDRDTVLIVLSDHGEHLGEHHVLGHSISLHEELLHVPAVAWGAVDSGAVQEPVSTIALRSFILDRAGVPVQEQAPAPTGEFESAIRVGHQVRAARPLIATQGTALYDGEWKLWAESDGRERFFAVSPDGEEEMGALPEDVAGRLRHRRDAWRSRIEVEGAGAAEAMPAPRRAGGPDDGLTEAEQVAVEEHLRDLGYLE